MDPFTEKLLERTRARRENLHKKMAERPTSANRQMVKRGREPLTDTNSVIAEPQIEKVCPSSKPSPSKRRCSEENTLFTGEENKEPVALHCTASEAITEKKPPMVPNNIRCASVENTVVTPSSESTAQYNCPPSGTEKIVAGPSQAITIGRDNAMEPSVLEKDSKAIKDAPAPMPHPTSMKSRLKKLADQRQYWDSEGNLEPGPNSIDLSPLVPQRTEVASIPAPTFTSSETPLGRKGRLANLAATINSWEDDLGLQPTSQDKAQVLPATAHAEKSSSGKTWAATKPPQPVLSASKSIHNTQQLKVNSPVKSSRVTPPSPQKTELTKHVKGLASPVSSPQKIYSSQPSNAPKSPRVPSSPRTIPLSNSPQKAQVQCKNLGANSIFNSSPIKPNFLPKPSPVVGPALPSEKLAKEPAPLQQRGPAGTACGVKSFLERFGERCQEHNGSQTTSSTAILAQKQKMEREAELAQIRSRFQNGNTGKDKENLEDIKNESEYKNVEETPENSDPVLSDESSAVGLGILETSSKLNEKECAVLKPSQSSPLKEVQVSVEKPEIAEQKIIEEEEIREIEMNVDGSINSEVINDLFGEVLEENEGHSAEEEDALNISSMSLLAPLVETVAAVVKSPEKKLMTSTPANSFNQKSGTPDGVSRPTRFQRARMQQAGSSDSIETLEEQKLLYSIDAYRSTRVKETERPQVKQVIVRKEDVAKRVEESGSPSHINIKQKMQILTNEMNLQQTVIHQASQALNCCTDEEHGKGSQVEAEAERLLLIATEKRVALKAELERLKAEGPIAQKKCSFMAQEDMGVPASRGSITLQELRLPLKAEFVCSSANKPESGNHYFFVMIRAGPENTVATPLANTRSVLSGDALTFSTRFTLPNVSSDFEIDIEVYYLVQKRELPSDKRKKTNKSKAITPKRFLAISKTNLQTPVMASPGGPNAVRTSNFILVGSHKLTLASIGKNKFLLEKIKCQGSESKLLCDMFQNKVPFLCPMEGHIYLKMQCEVGSRVEERGFLTMFEDVSGFGAWHRRWCVLSGYCISYWTYPDDEKRKNPIGRINLASCTSRKVEPANREFCARPNTFELITVRPQREDDKETLVSQCKNTMCVTKNWLSADTKEERNLWMQKLNQILVDLRMWQPDSCYRPV
ncbi:anillin isoform X2 [Hoplias malabaricus]|uniref:anillin isoform X2 n=1 Tax=Hoplias malabaricus TaxID=27720 RepID=UPI0034629AFA